MSVALAHEITQPLGAIENYALAARRRVGEGSPDLTRVADLLDKVIGQATRAGDVVTRMRTMVQRHELEPKEIDVARAVTQCIDMVKTECELRDIRIDLKPAGVPPRGPALLSPSTYGVSVAAGIGPPRRRVHHRFVAEESRREGRALT